VRTIDFFRYLTPLPRDEAWGITVTAGGQYTAKPGADYPPVGHPSDHHFEWQKGRVLGAYQLLYIVSGHGRFDSKLSGEVEVKGGQVVMVFPHTWHRYHPDIHSGWSEKWIELRGPVLAELEREGILNPYDPVVPAAERATIGTLFHKILEAIRSGSTSPDPTAGAWALQILAQLHSNRVRRCVPKPLTLALAKAEQMMNESSLEITSLETLAEDLGFAYSHFRREFKVATGMSPGRYMRRLRLEKARRLVGTTSEPIKAIAKGCGFSSVFHFSAAFKRQFGISPGSWRKKVGT